MPVSGACRINLDMRGSIAICEELAKYTVSGRGTTDITQADEQDFNHCALPLILVSHHQRSQLLQVLRGIDAGRRRDEGGSDFYLDAVPHRTQLFQ